MKVLPISRNSVLVIFPLVFSVPLVGGKSADQEDDETKNEGEGDKARYWNEITHKHLPVKNGTFRKRNDIFHSLYIIYLGGQ